MNSEIELIYEGIKDQLIEKYEEIWILQPNIENNKLVIEAEIDFHDFQIFYLPIPNFPTPNYNYTIHEDYKILIDASSFENFIISILLGFKEVRNTIFNVLQTLPTPDSSIVKQFDFDEMEIEMEINQLNSFVQNNSISKLENLLKEIEAKTKWNAKLLTFDKIETNMHSILLFINPNELSISNFTATSWRIDLTKFLCIQVDIEIPIFEFIEPMKILTFQRGFIPRIDLRLDTDKSSYGVEWIVLDRITKWISMKWPFNNIDNPFLEMIKKFESVLLNCAKQCIVCSNDLQYSGTIPSVCNNNLCLFSMESFSFGINVQEYILRQTELFELHVTLTLVAADNYLNDPSSFMPHPNGVIWKGKNKQNKIITKSFMTNSDTPNVELISKTINSIPKTDLMLEWISIEEFEPRINQLDPLILPLLKWMLSSNRTFLRPLNRTERIKKIPTDLQYVMHNSTPEKESVFNELKKKHGSRFVWHGSPLYCIFSILRQGLKNMSGTKHQLNGSAYGSGIYLADSSSTSVGYMKYLNGWNNSIHFKDNLGCLMLCEIINIYTPNPYYVVPENDHVQTRFFFILNQNNSYNVDINGSIFPNEFPIIEGFNEKN